jgi:hypothetical protein
MNRVATISCPEHSILIAFPAAAGTVESQGQFDPVQSIGGPKFSSIGSGCRPGECILKQGSKAIEI